MQSVKLFVHTFDAIFKILVGISPLTFFLFFRRRIFLDISSGKTVLNSKHFSGRVLYFSFILIIDGCNEYFLMAVRTGSFKALTSSTFTEYHFGIESSEVIFAK